MNTEIGKILRFIINYAKLNNYIYKPTGEMLSSVILPTYNRDEELFRLFSSRGISRFFESYKIYGSATAFHALTFLKITEGRAIMRRILENSSFATTHENKVDDLLDELLDEFPQLVGEGDHQKYI